ncbi:NOL1/NOP2/sun family protein [Tothia fuscella]|uniref:NOL1/NOP2/sun family protein n=1 Tax=Tothia fuscella TaxID=1048955 RepID=A0A9P4U475_9PEZI|nr:NOL1/NOP2/sun family protein [Tothia fuscella]
MGKNFRGRGRGRGGGGGRGRGAGNRNNWENTRGDYKEVVKSNKLFEKYYDELNVVEEDEKSEFWTALRRELPNSFRFAGSKGHALAVQKRLVEHYIPEITSVRYDGEAVEPPRPVEWFPEKLAWSMTTPKNVVRKFAPFKSFQKFLVSETSVGNISRQEIVSMIPPLLMDVRPGHTVLDLCAAPGSKSAQLIEMVHGGEEARIRKVVHRLAKEQDREASPDGLEVESEKDQAENEDDYSDDGRATGLLIANDVDYRRAQMLVHQVKRLNSPNMIVTNHDATQFPSIRIPSSTGTTKYLKFDRILADVPCSGDGTCRKNPNVWKDWIPGNGLGLHIMQVRILIRSLQMLKVGGRVVYSTCSMNPVENEAVISSALDRCGGNAKVRILDCSKSLPGLKRYSGMKQWKIMDKSGRMWSSWKEVEEAKAASGEDGFARLEEGMFPATDLAEAEQYPLQNCMRVYPHSQDTGGFFITVLEKLSEIRAKPEDYRRSKPAAADLVQDDAEEAPVEADSPSNIPGSPSKKRILEDAEDGTEPSSKKLKTEDDTSTESPAEAGAETNGHSKPERYAKPERNEQFKSEVATPQDDHSGPNVKKKSNQPHEEPFKYLAPDHPELLKIYDFYKVSDRFPRDRFMVRNATGEPVKAIYYTAVHVRDILQLNESRGMKFVMCGVKMFMKQDAQGQDICRWRIQSEGIPILETYVGEERIVRLYKRETLRKLLIEMFPKVGGDGWKDMAEIGERVRDMGMGCCVLRVETSDAEDGFKERIVLPLWRSMQSLNLMLPKEERKAMLLRLYNDDSPLIDHNKERNMKPNGANSEEDAKSVIEEDADDTGGVLLPTEAEAENVPEDKVDVRTNGSNDVQMKDAE